MKRKVFILTSAFALTLFLTAQAFAQQGETSDNKRSTRVVVTGNSTVRAQPDTANIFIAVITQSKTAIDAQQQNATRTDAVVRALKSAAGAGAEIKTSGYTIEPQRVYKENQPQTIVGYEARNRVTVTMNDLKKVGPLLDAAAQSGANNIDGISFTLRNDREARAQALAEATREAMSKAQTLAQTLGGRVLRIVEVQEGGAMPRPIYQDYSGGMSNRVSAQAVTPVEVGTLDINSQVQLVALIETPQ
ncbi:MAG: SIMPL domain-containing protein [Pyrinomonadaceae bacterium]